MEELVQSYLRSLYSLLVALGTENTAAQRVASYVYAGHPDAGMLAEFYLKKSSGGLLGARAFLPLLFDSLAEVTPLIKQAKSRVVDLENAGKILADVGVVAESLNVSHLAYNIHEAAYELLAVHDRPALHCAEKLRQLSNPQNVDQYHTAIWRLAIERLRHACDYQAHWLPALDVIELALTCPVSQPELQQTLLERLNSQISRTGEAVIRELSAIVTLQAPASAVDADLRRQLITMLASAKWGSQLSECDPALVEYQANLEAQVMFDNMRLKLLPRKKETPRLNTHDRTFHHHRLIDAVPLGVSLIAEPRRTAQLLVDMAHEIGHAVVLQGALGAQQAVYRAVVTFCEVALQPELITPGAQLAALVDLPSGDSARVLANIQLGAAEKAAVELAVWRPWLEGISMYIELLCNPKDDPSQISPVYTCLRSLIDFNIPKEAGEEKQQYIERFTQTVINPFETFLSGAIVGRSRLAHIGYFNPREVTAREIYCLGYLLVRSIVSAWERTMGRHISPGVAVKLLIQATQSGTIEAVPDPLADAPTHWEQAQRRHLVWLRSLSKLSKNELEAFFAPIPSDARGRQWVWRDGRPHPTDPDGEAVASRARGMRAEHQAASLAGLDPTKDSDTQRVLLNALMGTLARQQEWSGLLPIGSDKSRLVFLGNSGRVSLVVRTYYYDVKGPEAVPAAAAETGANPDPASPAAEALEPRYNIRSWLLEGGEVEADCLRQAFGRAGTARVHVTRIFDLVGHPSAPRAPDSGSYICAFLPPDFIYVMDGLTKADISKSHPAFAKMLASRVFPPFAFPNEEATIASLAFLGDRAKRSRFNPRLPAPPSDDSLAELSQDVAFSGAALAFAGGSVEKFRSAYEAAMQAPAYRVGIARLLYASGLSLPLEKDYAVEQPALKGKSLSKLVFSSAACSAVTPFGGMS